MVIELKKGVATQIVLNLKELIKYFVDHRVEVITRRTEYDLNQARAKAHILEGLLIAQANIEEVIRIIRESENTESARTTLMNRFKLSEKQAQAILDMPLKRLTALEKLKIEQELQQLREFIAYCEDLLAHPEKILAVIKDEIDVALTVIYNNEINPSLDYKKIDDTQLIFSVNKNHPLSNKKEISFRDLQNIPLILLKEDSLQYKIVIDFFKSYGIKPNIRLLSDQIATIKELLIYGNLGAFLFNQVIKENDDIVGIPLKENIHFDVVIAYKKNKTITKTTKRFINFILDNKKVN